jgi:hypothetical protein
MNKNYFKIFYKLNKEWLILAFLFFIVLGLVFSPQTAKAQIEGFSLNCGWADLFCHALEGLLSGILKIVILIFFGIPLLISALFVGITSLILGWIISPDFISLKFTQNPFVNIGLSITRNFANMGFIIFLVAIGLATALRIEEYKAKKTLPILIIVALLINFSPVLCGFIIDASNIVMNFFLSHVTGLLGFYNFVMEAAKALWNLMVESGFNLWANISAAMQIIVMIVFNFFAGYIFILFSANFIMRYIMLWILVILSPIAFVSYILPVTRRGRTLLNWRTWWEQLVAWSIIGIIAAFFLYLGFTMIAMINANPRQFVCLPGDKNCGPGGLGLMNNILPYLIPLVLLWIAHKEKKRTSAWFAREIMETTEKVTKGAVMAATIAATAGFATAMVGKLKGAAGTLSSADKFERWREAHPTAGTLVSPMAKFAQWGRRGVEEKVAPAVKEKVVAPVRERAEEFAKKHPEFAGYVKEAGKGIKTALLGTTEKRDKKLTEEQIAGGYTESKPLTEEQKISGYTKPRKLEEGEIKERRVKIKELSENEIKEGWAKTRELTDEEKISGYTKEGRKLTEREIDEGWEGRELTEKEKERGWIAGRELKEEELKTGYLQEGRALTEEEKKIGYLQEGRPLTEREKKEGWTLKRIRRRGGIAPTVLEGFKKGVKEFIEARAKVTPLAKEKRREILERIREKYEREEKFTEEEWREYEEAIAEIKERRERGEEVTRGFIEELLEKEAKEEAKPPRIPRRRPLPKEEKPKPAKEEKPEEKKPPGDIGI